jgi:glycosyltransferase involved in cell wall biosynthesis
MRVLLISHTCQSITEGQPKAHALQALGDVTLRVLVPDRWKRYGQWRQAERPAEAAFEFTIGRVRFPWLGPAQTYMHYYPDLAGILREFRPDVIDLWEEPWSRVSVQACKLRNELLPDTKIVSETEQNIYKELPFPFEGFRNFTLSQADFVVGRSNEALQVIRRKGYEGPMQMVPNAFDSQLFRPMNRSECRKQAGVIGFVVGYVGRLVEEKGLMDLAEAVAKCPPQVNLLCVGDGPLRDQLLNHPCGRIHVLRGRALQEIPALMNAMDVLVLPSRTTASWKEQFGRVLIEANACGTPVIGSASGAIPDVVGDGGLVAPEADPGKLAKAIVRLMNDPDGRTAFGEAGRRQALEKYTWKRVAEQMREIYRKIATPSPAPGAGRERRGRRRRISRVSGRRRSSQMVITSPSFPILERFHGEKDAPTTKRKRILFIDHTAVMGGGEIALLHLVKNLYRYEPIVALLSNGPLASELATAGVKTYLIEAGGGLVNARKESLSMGGALESVVPTVMRLVKLIQEVDADVVHCNSLKADLLGGIAGRLVGVPVIWHIRDRIADDYLPAKMVKLLRFMANAVPTHVIANSRATLETVRLFDAANSSVIYSGLDLDPYLRIGPKTSGPVRVGIVGRLAPWKGQHVFLQAAALVRKQFPGAVFQMVGSPLFSETEYEKRLHAQAKSLGIEDVTEFTGHRKDVPELLAQMDVVVHASTTAEPFGQVAVLAMAAGRPLVATAGGGILESVIHGKTGLLVAMGDASAMAAAIVSILSDSDLAASLSNDGRMRVMDLFTISKTAGQTMQLYDRLTA